MKELKFLLMYGTNHPQLKQSTRVTRVCKCKKHVWHQTTRVKFNTRRCKIKCNIYTRIVARFTHKRECVLRHTAKRAIKYTFLQEAKAEQLLVTVVSSRCITECTDRKLMQNSLMFHHIQKVSGSG